MYIEIIIGISGAIAITLIFQAKAYHKKEKRGLEAREFIIRDSIIGIREQCKTITKTLSQNPLNMNPTNREIHFKRIKDYTPLLSSMLSASGDALKVEQHRKLSRIIGQISHEPDYQNDLDIIMLCESIIGDCTEFLKDNKDALQNIHNQLSDMIVDKVKKSKNVNMRDFYMRLYLEQIDKINDILTNLDRKSAEEKMDERLKKIKN